MNRKEWLIAAILTFVTICAWRSFSIIHTRSSVEISPEVQQLIEPVNPNFDTKVLESDE